MIDELQAVAKEANSYPGAAPLFWEAGWRGATLAEAEKRWGALPPTFMTTSGHADGNH